MWIDFSLHLVYSIFMFNLLRLTYSAVYSLIFPHGLLFLSDWSWSLVLSPKLIG